METQLPYTYPEATTLVMPVYKNNFYIYSEQQIGLDDFLEKDNNMKKLSVETSVSFVIIDFLHFGIKPIQFICNIFRRECDLYTDRGN